MRSISTRQYEELLQEMASTCIASKSNVSREAEARAEALQELLGRRRIQCTAAAITRFATWSSGCRKGRRTRKRRDASPVRSGSESRHRPTEEARRKAVPGPAGSGASLREGLEECFTLNRLESALVAAPLPGHHQSDRESAIQSPHADAACVAMASRCHDAALGRGFLPSNGEGLPQDHGPERSLAIASSARKTNSCFEGSRRVRKMIPIAAFNL